MEEKKAMSTSNLLPIWGGKKIEILGLTGDFSSGKTLFALTIDPKNTLVIDVEKSSGSYEDLGESMKFTRIDLPNLVQSKCGSGYTALDTFRTWLDVIDKVKPGQYSVIVVDPITDLETGLVEWVKSRYDEYGFSSADKFEALGGVFWAKISEEWNKIFLDIATRCQTFVFTAHLKSVWKNGRATSEMIPKGKKTLFQLSSLYLFLDRDPRTKGGQPPMKPHAHVLKQRLVTMNPTTGEMQAILPPRLEVATPAEIRKYIANPPDYDNLSADEKSEEREVDEMERLQMELQASENRKAAEEASLEKARLQSQKGSQPLPGEELIDHKKSVDLIQLAIDAGLKDEVVAQIEKIVAAKKRNWKKDPKKPIPLTTVEYNKLRVFVAKKKAETKT